MFERSLGVLKIRKEFSNYIANATINNSFHIVSLLALCITPATL